MLYYIKSINFYNSINSIKGGSAQDFLSLEKLGSVKINYPNCIKTQNRIADILSAYDDLIENNQKQIKLLEEMAQRIYKEWFIDLRFPDYENTDFIDGMPLGWDIKSLEDIAILKAGGDKPKTFSKNKTSNNTIPVYSNSIDNKGLYGYTDKPKIMEDCITISARGTIGYVCLRRNPFVPIVRLITIIPENIEIMYLYLLLLKGTSKKKKKQ